MPQYHDYERSECAVFRRTGERFGGLSNKAPGFPLRVNKRPIRTSEALYQALRFPSRPDVQRAILDDPSPMGAKMVGKPFRETDCRKYWEEVKAPVMRYCLRVKLAQNRRTFGAVLRETGDLPIVEESHRQDFWATKAVRGQPDLLRGENQLGLLLMDLRDELKLLHPTANYQVEPLEIEDFLLLGKPIGPV